MGKENPHGPLSSLTLNTASSSFFPLVVATELCLLKDTDTEAGSDSHITGNYLEVFKVQSGL